MRASGKGIEGGGDIKTSTLSAKKVSWLSALPIIICIALAVWHVGGLYFYSLTGFLISHIAILVVSALLLCTAVLIYNLKNKVLAYMERAFTSFRPHFIGLSCFLVGALHFLTFSEAEPVYLQIGFLVSLLACYETGSISNRFRIHLTGGYDDNVRASMLNLLANQFLLLFITFVLSAGSLYLALVAVVGFTSVWSVLVLVCVLFLLLAVLVKLRKL
jgi:hypothetical protein